MAAAFKICGKKAFYAFDGDRGANDISAEADDIGVIVTARHFGFELVMYESRANAIDFICRDRNADTGTTDEDAGSGFFVGNGVCHGCTEFGIIAGIRVVRPLILGGVTELEQRLFELFFKMKTSVVTANSYD